MNPVQRQRIRGIHTGGLALSPESPRTVQEFFPQADILADYGNSPFGVIFPLLGEKGGEDVLAGHDASLWLQLAPLPGSCHEVQDLRNNVQPGQRGRVIVHRLDPTFLILNLPERDTAIARALGDGALGLADIAPLEFASPQDRQGVY